MHAYMQEEKPKVEWKRMPKIKPHLKIFVPV